MDSLAQEMPVLERSKRIFFAAVLILLVLSSFEIGLSLTSLMSLRATQLLAAPWTPYLVPDARLGVRPNPDFIGSDRKGFRNAKLRSRVHTVALGDSQTYGYGVSAAAAWPQQLESMIGKPVYNMGVSASYGPTQSLMLWDEALGLQPDIVIEAFSGPTDLYDSFNHVYNLGQLAELRTPDPVIQERIRQLERLEPISERAARLARLGFGFRTQESTTASENGGGAFRPFSLLSTHSKTYGFLRRVRYEFATQPDAGHADPHRADPGQEWASATAFAALHPEYCEPFDDGRFRTILTSAYRLLALDLDDPRIAEGLQISLGAMRTMHERAAAKHIRFIVLLMPTKETVFRELVQNPSPSFLRLIGHEERVWNTIKGFLDRHGIEHVDALPALQKELRDGRQPFRVSKDGHPNEDGHETIARLVSGHLDTKRPH